MKEAYKSRQTSNSPHKALSFKDLPALTLELKGEESWPKNGRVSGTIYKSEALRILLNVLQAGTEIKTH